MNCPDCNVSPGDVHLIGCDVERCPECGHQLLSCGCDDMTSPRLPWNGAWPGVSECVEFGWYAKLVRGKGWVQCGEADPEASPDLNRLYKDAKWDKTAGKFVR